MARTRWPKRAALAAVGVALLAAGCQESAPPSPAPAATNQPATSQTDPSTARQPSTAAAASARRSNQPAADALPDFPPPKSSHAAGTSMSGGEPSFPPPKFDPATTDPALRGRPIDPGAPLADLMEQAQREGLVDGQGNLTIRPAREIDAARAAAAGIRELRGQYVRIYTDLPASDEVDRLPAVFDAAYPQWCEYFGVPRESNPPWRANAFIMQNKERFKAAGLLPEYLPEFENGFAEGHELYIVEQPTEYYRRHLLLHEGTHSFMLTRLTGSFPTWYFEGMAELFGTHRVDDGPGGLKVQTRYMPRDRDEVPYWGRTKLIADAYREGRARNLKGVFAIEPSRNMGNEDYAWSWAVCYFFDMHPAYRERFRTLFKLPAGSDFMEAMQKLYEADSDQVVTQWQVFITGLDYGYELERAAIRFQPGQPLPASGATVAVATNCGWHSTGIRLQAGQTYELTATGRYRVANEAKPWYSEPDGVTIRYHDGLPLGMLVAAVQPDHVGSGVTPLIKPVDIGSASKLTPQQDGTLYVKINEATADLADNEGSLRLTVKATQ